ncbi:MAG: hypothetical protein H7Y09_08785 [Chitinophagaceae bacterium]|nr:hypothetical protein [Anaerolineae bacterium]
MKTCEVCGKTLTGSQRKFCSIHCKQKTFAPNYGTAAYRPMPEREGDNCIYCDKPLIGRQTLFCSRQCKIKGRSVYPSQNKRKRSRKIAFIELRDGQCKICGYDKNLSGLSFHHRENKEFTIDSHTLGRLPLQKSLKELEKCDLLCHNCHFEHHYPWMTLVILLEQSAKGNLLALQPSQTHRCIICEQELTGSQKQFCSRKCSNSYHQNYENQQRRGIERKVKLVNQLGGRCTQCGYNKNLASLIFHHTSGKSYGLDLRSIANRSLDSLMAEFEKCVLLCHNCHAELHNPQLDKNEVTKKHSN